MKTTRSLHLRATLVLTTLAAIASLASAAPASGTVKLLLKPRAHASEAALAALMAVHGAREVDTIPALNVRILEVPAVAAARMQAAFAASSDVDYVEPDYPAKATATTNDLYLSQEWHLAKINASTAWDVTVGAPGVIIAIVDSGVSSTHPDLVGRLLPGYDFINGDADPQDDFGHGTGVAGAAAAAGNNGIGVAGVAWGSPLLPVKVLDATGNGTYSTMAQGIIFAADSGARIINLSLGGTAASATLQEAVNYAWSKSSVLIAAAGNNGNDVPVYPAACQNVVAVSATDANDARASFSNYGTYVDVAAPGVGILTTTAPDLYTARNGTSFASPVTAGVAALMASAWPQGSNAGIVDLLVNHTDDLGAPGADVYYGSGRINAARAVDAALAAEAIDITAPAAYFGAPAASAVVKGSVMVSGDATDNVGVAGLELRIDGVAVATTTEAALSHVWNTVAVPDGNHVLELRAVDAAGNVGVASRTVRVANYTFVDTIAPVSAITSPTTGTKLSGKTVSITAKVTDNIAVTKTELYLDGALFSTTTSTRPKFSLTLSKLTVGAHVLQVFAYDAAGNSGASAPVTVYK